MKPPQSPVPTVKTTITRTVSLELDQEMVESILAEWVQAKMPEFHNMNPDVSISSGHYEGCRFSCTVTGKVEETKP